MWNKIKPLLLVSILFVGFTIPHDYHVTITEIRVDSESNVLTVAHQLFIDDLERALSKNTDINLSQGLEEEDSAAVELVLKYINSRFKMTADKPIQLDYVGYEWEDHHGLWFYFQNEEVGKLDAFKVKNEFFIDLFDDQENMHYIYFDEEKSDLMMNKEMTEGTVTSPTQK